MTYDTNVKEINTNDNDPDVEIINIENTKILQRYHELSTESGKIPGNFINRNPSKPPSWFDPVAFQHAQKLYKSNCLIFNISHLLGLFLGLSTQPDLLLPLLTTGNSATISRLFKRYVSTVLHIRIWFHHDPFERNSKAFRSLKQLRSFHAQAAQKLNKPLENQELYDEVSNNKHRLWLSQRALLQVQFSFVGFMALFPKQLGYHLLDDYDVHSIYHFWRVIFHGLGLDDRFNLCSGTDDEILQMCHVIYEKDWLPVLQSEEIGVEMAKCTTVGFQKLIPFVNYNALFHYAAPFLQLNRADYPLVSLTDKFAYLALVFVTRITARSRIATWLITKFGDAVLYLQFKFSVFKMLEQRLEQKYESSIAFKADERCPVRIEIHNYKDVFEENLY